jgi:hypothetical protein
MYASPQEILDHLKTKGIFDQMRKDVSEELEKVITNPTFASVYEVILEL